jgi:hypothetical protein
MAGSAPLCGQTNTGGDSVLVTPSTKYDIPTLLAPLIGEGYRDLWRTPIRVPVLDLGSLGGGGLQPVRVGGNFMTRTLHTLGADGRRYVLRTVDKFPAQSLPLELQGTIYARTLQGQVAKLHPTGAVVADRILTAAEILHPSPVLFHVPDDPRLGEFREMFAGELVLFEARPDEGEGNTVGFAGSRSIKNTGNFMDDLEEDPRNRLDASEFLRARLLDLVLGDRDRNKTNWLWARFDDPEGGYIWRPLPRDRDQVFVDFDGAGAWLARLVDPRIITFGEDMPSVFGLTRNAWDMDRPFLVGLSREDWEEVVEDLQGRLSDSVIENAVQALPAAHHEAAGAALEQALRSRREQLPSAASEFYEIVNRAADIVRTDHAEYALLRHLEGGRVEVAVFGRDGVNPAPSGPAHFRRVFDPRDTREIRLYLKGGDDYVVLEGDGDSSIRLRVMGGGGTDDLDLRSPVRSGRVTFYDEGDTGRVAAGEGVRLLNRQPRLPEYWHDDGTGPGTPDWGGVWLPSGKAGYSSSKGIVLGVGAARIGYGFEQDLFRYRAAARIAYATRPSKPIVEAEYEVQNVARNVHLFATTLHSPIKINSFNGLGNETGSEGPPDFFSPGVLTTDVRAGLRFSSTRRFQIEFGASALWTDSDTTETGKTLLANERPYGSGEFGLLGLFAELVWDGRANPGRPSRGARMRIGGSFQPQWLEVDRGTFGGLDGDASLTVARKEDPYPQLALRLGGAKVFGEFPFFEGAYLGGENSVRGLKDERYLGDGVVYGSIEGRAELFHVTLVLPAKIGGLAFLDTGRVFLSEEISRKWHTGVGLGIWAAPNFSEYPQMADLRAVLSVGFSEGHRGVYLGVEQAF